MGRHARKAIADESKSGTGSYFYHIFISLDRYLLACSRYIEMNPIRAGIVENPGDYKFSSYNAKTGKDKLTWLDHDPAYMALGKTDGARQTAYQRWFQESIPKAEWELIREAVKRNWAFGNNRFKEEMEKALERRFEVKKAGRKLKIRTRPRLGQFLTSKTLWRPWNHCATP